MEILVRAATPDDAAGIVSVFNPIIAAGRYTAFDTPFTVEAECAYIEQMSPRDIFHVATSQPDGCIVGFQSLSPFATYTQTFAHVGMLGTFVDLNHQRQGIARRLFAATFTAARALGYEKLFTYVRADNERGLAAYLSQGFRVVGTAQHHAKVNGVYIDEIIIERFLDAE
jgi:L-amino acid N-acyltransferase YncA